MNVDKNTGLPQLHNSHLWFQELVAHSNGPHHGTSFGLKTGMVDDADELNNWPMAQKA